MKKKQKKGNSFFGITLICLLLCTLGGMLFLRCRQHITEKSAVITTKESETYAGQTDEGRVTATAAYPTDNANDEDKQLNMNGQPIKEPEELAQPVHGIPKRYTAETYKMVTDLVYTYRVLGTEGKPQIQQTLDALKKADQPLGALWEGIMNVWFFAGEDLNVSAGVLPENLSRDDSLCIVVLGYQLLYDGKMAPELNGRCETALSLLRLYPNAYLALAGGGTAPANKEVTEAEMMAAWFAAHGISEEKMILERNSMTTGQNAQNTCAILAEQFPQIKELAIVTSDYHIPQSIVLFTEAALLYSYINDCEIPYEVNGFAAFATSGNPEYSNPSNFASDIWTMADPNY